MFSAAGMAVRWVEAPEAEAVELREMPGPTAG